MRPRPLVLPGVCAGGRALECRRRPRVGLLARGRPVSEPHCIHLLVADRELLTECHRSRLYLAICGEELPASELPSSHCGPGCEREIVYCMECLYQAAEHNSERGVFLTPPGIRVYTADSPGALWQDTNLVFCTKVGTELDAANVRRGFRSVVTGAGIDGSWTPRELRHSFVSLLSANGVPVESIAQLVGHAGTAVTQAVYRKELRPVLTDGAQVIGSIFTCNKSAG